MSAKKLCCGKHKHALWPVRSKFSHLDDNTELVKSCRLLKVIATRSVMLPKHYMEKDGRCFTPWDFTQGALASHSTRTSVRDVWGRVTSTFVHVRTYVRACACGGVIVFNSHRSQQFFQQFAVLEWKTTDIHWHAALSIVLSDAQRTSIRRISKQGTFTFRGEIKICKTQHFKWIYHCSPHNNKGQRFPFPLYLFILCLFKFIFT